MVFKIQKPIFSTEEDFYLAYNKKRNVVMNDIQIGQVPQLDEMFDDELKIYVEGYVDRKARFIIKRQIENQDW